MTLSGLVLQEKVIVTPAIQVAAKELTATQADKMYKGVPCACPHCLSNALEQGIVGFFNAQKLSSAVEFSLEDEKTYQLFVQRHGIAAAVLEAATKPESIFARLHKQYEREPAITDLRALLASPNDLIGVNADTRFVVSFRRASLGDQGQIRRFMCFQHLPGQKMKELCYEPAELSHYVTCKALEIQLRKNLGQGYEVTTEYSITTPSGNEYRLDVAVLKNGTLHDAYEIQRSSKSLKDLKQKTLDLAPLCKVKWIFFKGIYSQMADQREWLATSGYQFYVLDFRDSQVELADGSPPLTRQKYQNGKSNQSPSSSNCQYAERIAGSVDQEESFQKIQLRDVKGVKFKSIDEAVNRASRNQANLTDISLPLPETVSTKQKQLKQEWGVLRNIEVEVFVKGTWARGTVWSFDAEGKPIIKLSRKTNGQRIVTPADKTCLRKLD